MENIDEKIEEIITKTQLGISPHFPRSGHRNDFPRVEKPSKDSQLTEKLGQFTRKKTREGIRGQRVG